MAVLPLLPSPRLRRPASGRLCGDDGARIVYYRVKTYTPDPILQCRRCGQRRRALAVGRSTRLDRCERTAVCTTRSPADTDLARFCLLHAPVRIRRGSQSMAESGTNGMGESP